MAKLTTFSIRFPDYYDGLELEYEAKGYFADSTIVIDDVEIRPTFYDPVRLSQTIEADLDFHGFFCEPHVIVVPSVNRRNMIAAVEKLASGGFLDLLGVVGKA